MLKLIQTLIPSKDYQLISQKKSGKKGLEGSFQNHERQGPTSKIILSSKAIILNGRADKVLPR